jgi:hypothetical protein
MVTVQNSFHNNEECEQRLTEKYSFQLKQHLWKNQDDLPCRKVELEKAVVSL